MAKQIDSSNLGYLLGKIRDFFWKKSETSQLTIDNTPTTGSNNLVTSGGVKAYVDGAIPSPITVDQTYDGTSANAQSGVAMAGALALKANIADIPSALSELSEDTTHRTVTDTEKATWNGKYSKPSTGIPASDLASGVIPTTYAGSPSAGGPANKTLGIPYGEVDSTSTATEITATVDNFPETLTAGVCAYIRNDVIASASGWTLNINGTGALPVYVSNADATRATTTFSAATTYIFVYNPTRVEGGCWDMYYGYNANDNTIGYNLRTNTMSLPVTSACYRYRLLFTSKDGTQFVPANASTSTNATSARTTTQTPIDPFGTIRYYSYTTAVSSGNRPGVTYLWEQYLVTLGYSFNRTGAALTLTSWMPVYIKCAPQSDGSAIIDADNPYVQELPSTEDGKIYIYLGVATSATQVEVTYYHPVFYFKDGAIRLWTNAAAGATDAVKYTTQSLTDAQKAQARTNIGATAPEVFWAEYGVTTIAEIKAQVDAGKLVMLLHPTAALWGVPLIYYLKVVTVASAEFEASFMSMQFRASVNIQDGDSVWAEFYAAVEMVDFKVASWQTTPDNDHYPSEKLVKDSLNAKQDTIDASHKLDYSLLSNTPTIPTVPTISTNIQTDKASDAKTASPKAVYDEVHPAVQSTQPQGGFLPNVEYNLGTLTGNVTFALASAVSGIPNKWYWCFTAGATAPTITWPSGLLWPQPDAEPPTIEANDEVEVEVKNGHIVALVFKPTS